MWAKLGNELINLDHILRVKFSKSWNKDGECLVAEVETLLSGEIKQLIRYRGPEAEMLQAVLQLQTVEVELPQRAAFVGARPTMHDLTLPPASPALVGASLRSPNVPTLTDI